MERALPSGPAKLNFGASSASKGPADSGGVDVRIVGNANSM